MRLNIKKKIVITLTSVVALLLIVATVIGCVFLSHRGEGWTDIVLENSLGSHLILFNKLRNVPLDQIEPYDFKRFTSSSTFRGTTPTWTGSQFVVLGNIAASERYRVDHLIKLDLNSVCMVMPLELNGKTAYQYMIFDYTIEYGWLRTGEFYFVSKRLSSSDFDSISVGNSAEAIEDIDSAVVMDAEYPYYKGENGSEFGGFYSYRLLDDGVLVFRLERTDISLDRFDMAGYEVAEKKFYAYDRSEELLDFDVPAMMDISVLNDPSILSTLK